MNHQRETTNYYGTQYSINEQSLSAGKDLSQYLTRCLFFFFFFQELFPANKRSCEHFSKYFTDAGLKELSDFARNQQSIGARKELQKELEEQMSRGDPLRDVSILSLVAFCKTTLRVPLKISFYFTSAPPPLSGGVLKRRMQ